MILMAPNGMPIIGPARRVLVQADSELVNVGGSAPVELRRGQICYLPAAMAEALMAKWFVFGDRSYPVVTPVDEEGNVLAPGTLPIIPGLIISNEEE